MELRRMEHLVKFWLEAESFHSTTWSRIRAHSLNTVKQSSLAEPVSPSKQQELASSPPAGWLEERLEGSGTAQLLQPQPDRTASSQNHAGLPGRESRSTAALPLSKPDTGTHSLPADQQESSKLSVSNRNSPSSALKDLSGKLMKSKCCVFLLVGEGGNGEWFCAGSCLSSQVLSNVMLQGRKFYVSLMLTCCWTVWAVYCLTCLKIKKLLKRIQNHCVLNELRLLLFLHVCS